MELFAALLLETQRTWLIAAAFLVLERCLPAERGQPGRLIAFNAVFAFAALAMIFVQAWVILQPLATWVVKSRVALEVAPVFHGALEGWNLAARMLLYLLVVDFFAYWRHRANHRFALLWRFHELHHSDQALNATTARREHWVNEASFFAVVTIPSLAIFGPLDVPIALVTAYVGWSFFEHANLRVELGPLTRVVVGPQVHRLHHSRLPEHEDCNFAALFPMYDILFGTYRHPSPGEFPPTGLSSGRRIDGHLQAHLEPLGLGSWPQAGERRAAE